MYWLQDDGIWQLVPSTTEPVHRVAIDEAKSVVGYWAVAGLSMLVMRRDHGNAVEEFSLGANEPTIRIPVDEDAQEVWAS